MVKHIISIAAAGAVLTTGAMAFDANSTGDIVTEFEGKLVPSSYTTGHPAINPLLSSKTQRGDALIYPAFNQKSGWGTEIIVRNTTKNAIVAKAVIYAADDSRELLDFNIYLSAKDICRFTIKDGKITSSDGSIKTYGIKPHQVDATKATQNLTDYRLVQFADTKALNVDMPKEVGYVAIYGMEQSSDYAGFHTGANHKDLYAAYAATLDEARDGWRDLTDDTKGAILNGMFVDQKSDVNASPAIADSATVDFFNRTSTGVKGAVKTATFDDVAKDSLSGHVRIFNDAGRDVLLPAKALENFTDGNRVLWSEGEYAALADRKIDATGKYDAVATLADAQSAFPATTATYTYANASGTTDNTLLITQPYKRILAQLLPQSTMNDTNPLTGAGYSIGKSDATTKKIATGKTYGFTIGSVIFDEAENGFEAAPDEIGGDIILSPRSTDTDEVTPESLKNELQEIKPNNLDKDSYYGGKYADKDGIMEVTIPVASIVTQMTASKAGSSDEINWVYSDTTTN